jgi:uncharacterized protein
MSALTHLELFITERCNLACPYCFAGNMEGKVIDRELARRALSLVLKEDAEQERVRVTLWGGEPLFELDLLKELVCLARDRARATGQQLRLGMATNATLLTDEVIDFVQEHQVGLSLSLDGDAAAQGLRRTLGGQSSFPLVERRLELIRRRYGEAVPGVRMTVSPTTVADFRHNVEYFLDRGFRQVFFAPVHETVWRDQDLALWEEEQRSLADLWVQAFRAGQAPSFLAWEKALAWRALRRRDADRGGAPGGGLQITCGAGDRMLAVDVHGDIYPCHRFVFYDKSGRTQSLGHVLSGGAEPERARSYLEIPQGAVGTAELSCERCPQRTGCHALCPAVNYALTGNIYRLDPRQCRLTQLEQRVVDYLEGQLLGEPAFERYVEKYLLQRFAPGRMSAEMASFWANLDDEAQDRIVDRAAGILADLAARRRSPLTAG